MPQAGGFQIIQALRAMDFVDRTGRLQFSQHSPFNAQINRRFPHHDPVIPNDHRLPL